MTFRPFSEAREYVRKLGLKSQSQWRKYCKSGNKPEDIPSYPEAAYDDNWVGYGDWLGTTYISTHHRKYRSFEEAREFARSLGLRNSRQWREYVKSGNKPDDIPANLPGVYEKEFKGWGNWLRTGNISRINRGIFWSYEEAKKYVHSLGFKNREDWRKWCKSGNKADYIPSNPKGVYKNQWISWGDWLGTSSAVVYSRTHRPYEEAKKYVHSLGFKNRREYEKWAKTGKKPYDMPAHPDQVYKNEGWVSWPEFLGYERTAYQKMEFLPFEQAREYVRSLGLKNRDEGWHKWAASENRPKNIPSSPHRIYKNKGWKDYGDWLGTYTKSTKNRKFLTFEEAKKIVHPLGFKSQDEYNVWCKSGKKPDNIPSHPYKTYKIEWKDWPDFLGYIETDWSVRRVKELLRDWIERGLIYEEEDIVLYSLLSANGLLNLQNRHARFFKNLIDARSTTEGFEAIKEYAYSDSEEPPELEGNGVLPDEELGTASTEEIADLVKNETDPLDYGKIKPIEQLLRSTERLDSYTEDIEKMQFFISKNIKNWWSRAFADEEGTVAAAKDEEKKGKYHDAVIQTFLSDYKGAKSIEPPEGYAFKKNGEIQKLKLMQQYVAYKIKTNRRFGNFSGTGAGKTLSAIASSRVVDSKMTVIICPNAVVDQWKYSIEKTFPDSVVIPRMAAFHEKYEENKQKYLVINYDLFSQPLSRNWVLELGEQKIDFVVLDEIHFTKRRNKKQSIRHHNIEGLLSKAKGAYVLGLSATPVINDLEEGKSLLELITGKKYDDVSNRPITHNAVKLYEKLSLISIREIPQYPVSEHVEPVYVDVDIIRSGIRAKQLKGPLDFEKLTVDAKIPEIIRHINGSTVIYTEYVREIIDKISNAVKDAGYSCAEYWGEDHSGIERFKQKEVQVLVASQPASTGVDGLQDICHNLIISALPWTNARYQQLVGRLVRLDQKNDVTVWVIKANIEYDGNRLEYDENKWKRILNKRALADCAVDGRLPEKNMVSPQQAVDEARRWLERLERGEISIIKRRDLDVKLMPVDIASLPVNQQQNLYRNLGDFSQMNKEFNTSNSDTIHEKIQNDPQYLVRYHEKMDETMKTWSVDPVKVIVNKINRLAPERVVNEMVIGDFGCGRARLAGLLHKNRVYSFDHHNILNEKIIACDMKKTRLRQNKLDIAVFSLSLMSQNWIEYIIEAKRCLVKNGWLFIAETTNQLNARLSTLKDEITKQGFEIRSEKQEGDFTFIEAMKL